MDEECNVNIFIFRSRTLYPIPEDEIVNDIPGEDVIDSEDDIGIIMAPVPHVDNQDLVVEDQLQAVAAVITLPR